MRKKISLFAAVLAVFGATAATAAPLITDLDGGTGYAVKYIAYEMYNNVTGVNSNQVEFFAKLNGDVAKGDSVNIQGTNASVNLGSGNLFLLGRGTDIAVWDGLGTGSANYHPVGGTAIAGRASGANGWPCTAGTYAGNDTVDAISTKSYFYIAESNATGVQDQVTALGVDVDTFCKLNGATAVNTALFAATDKVILMTPVGGATYMSTAQGSKVTAPGATQGMVVPSVTFALNLFIKQNLNPACTVPKDISLALVTNQETINPTVVLQIIPQFVGSIASGTGNGMQQELSTNDDFKLFIDATGTTYDNYDRTVGFGGTMFNTVDRQFSGTNVTNTYKGKFRSFVPQNATAQMDFTLSSISAEPGVVIGLNSGTTACTKASDAKSFACSTGASTTQAITDVATAMNTLRTQNKSASSVYQEMVPTNWTLSAFSFKVNSTVYCLALTGTVGNWYGGIEAIVPLVKTDAAAGYSTYIKMFNRYNKAAKLYVANMNKVSDSIVTSINQLPAPNDNIPTAGAVSISGDDLVSGGIITAAEGQYGAPIKFLIRVPSQSGGFTTLTDNVVPILNAGTAAGVAIASNVDPYINGVVVQVVPGGSQRSIPLLFKAFKQGQYN
jgi:hypothetical protein